MPSVFLWGTCCLVVGGLIFRPFRWPEAVWAVTGAALVVLAGGMTPDQARVSILKGRDVYLFLIGMMLLSELARKEGLFDWLATVATRFARGSPARLFALIYVIGIVVTIFLSNDATAVVLTPAVYAATRVAKVANPLPFLLICAFIANAASFVLPISNPANLVVFPGDHMPTLSDWLRLFLLPSILSIAATYGALYWTQRTHLRLDAVAVDIAPVRLSNSARIAGVGIGATAIVLLLASYLGTDLGWPTFFCGATTAAVVLLATRQSPRFLVSGISWSVLPLVAGLFVLVGGLRVTGAVEALAGTFTSLADHASGEMATLSGIAVALVSNLVNNLPAGLVAGTIVQDAGVSKSVAASLLIGVDLGPNLSVSGSLATILWLAALRREGVELGAWNFFKIGCVVTPAALVLALVSL